MLVVKVSLTCLNHLGLKYVFSSCYWYEALKRARWSDHSLGVWLSVELQYTISCEYIGYNLQYYYDGNNILKYCYYFYLMFTCARNTLFAIIFLTVRFKFQVQSNLSPTAARFHFVVGKKTWGLMHKCTLKMCFWPSFSPSDVRLYFLIFFSVKTCSTLRRVLNWWRTTFLHLLVH